MKVELQQIQEIFNNVFENSGTISSQTTQADIEAWDSIGHLNLILEIEDKLKVSLAMDDILALKSVNDLIEILNKY